MTSTNEVRINDDGMPVVSAQQQKKADDNLSAGRFIARKVCPYFRAMLLALVPRVAPGLGTVGVTDSGIFLYDPIAVATWTPKQCAGAVIHEVLHLQNRHGKRRGERDPGEWNLAGDRAINPGIFEMGLELPFKDVAMPKDIGMADGLTADEYYREAKKRAGSGGGQPRKGDPQLGNGKCGSCAGHANDGEPGPDDADGKTTPQIERAVRQSSEEMRETASGRTPGKVPSSWQRMADAALAPPKVPWQKRLAHAALRAANFTAGQIVHRYDFPSRRQAGLGYGEGVAVLPRLRAPVPNVGIAIDTSGSMSKAQLTAGLVECKGILKVVNAKVQVCVCDAEVHALDDALTVADITKMLKGGGGTDFRPVFAAFEKKAKRPEVLIFITDGWGPAPTEEPKWCKTIWLLVGANAPVPAPWGTAIHMDDLDEESGT